MMRLYLTLFAAAIAWIIVLYKLRIVRVTDTDSIQRALAVKIWSATLCAGIALTLLVDQMFVAFDRLVAMANLAWLVAYVFGSIAFYQVGTIKVLPHTQTMDRIDRGLQYILLALIPAYVVLYVSWIMHSPEWPERTPRTIMELVFSALFFGYGALIGIITLPQALTIYRQATVIPTQIRTGAGLLMVTFANGCFWFKLVFIFAVYFIPQQPSVFLLDKLALVSMGLAALVFAFSFIPQSVYIAVADSMRLPAKLILLKDLEYLRLHLNELYPKLPWTLAPWWDKLRNIDFHIYQTVIAILDIRQILFATSTVREDKDKAHPGEAATQQSAVVEQPIYGPSRQDKPEMQLLYHWLKIPETADYQAILDTLQQASKALRNV